jgi:hypothetical protein
MKLRRPRIGARASLVGHATAALLCTAAIAGETAVGLAWTLLALNIAAAAIIGAYVWIGELPEDRKPFGPFTEIADFFGFLDERTPQGRVVRRLEKLGLLEKRRAPRT